MSSSLHTRIVRWVSKVFCVLKLTGRGEGGGVCKTEGADILMDLEFSEVTCHLNVIDVLGRKIIYS